MRKMRWWAHNSSRSEQWLRLAKSGNNHSYTACQTHRIGLVSNDRSASARERVWTWDQHKQFHGHYSFRTWPTLETLDSEPCPK
jgi:hypothetical protein